MFNGKTNIEFKDIKDFVSDIGRVKQHYNILKSKLEDCDNLYQDLSHEIEFSNYDVLRGYKIYKEFKQMRIERRTLKDEIELLEPLINYINENVKTFNGLGKIQGECHKINDSHQNRCYRPRILTDMSERLPKVDFIIGG